MPPDGDPDADFFAESPVFDGFSAELIDLGLIAVSDTEIGVFWSITVD